MSGSGSGTNGGSEKEKEPQWYFTAEQLASSPSRRHNIDADQELSYRQMTAYLIQEMGQRLQVSQLCINTAIVYMHRFYAFHSFTHFHRNNIAAASLFLAAKVEEQPRKLEHVIKAGNKCLSQPTTSTTDAYYIEQAQELVFNENVLLQTLGFDVAIDHPHTHVVKTCHLVKACKDLAQTSYFLASNSLHLTSMCLQYKPTVVACFCIYLACKWSRWEIPQSTEGKHWFHYVDKTVTMDLLKQLTDEFIAIYEKSPSRLKSKLNSIKALAQGASNRAVNRDKKAPPEEWKMVDMMKMYHSSINTNDVVSGGIQSGNQSAAYSGQTSSEQQQPQTVTPALLPPPLQTPQQQRKADLHSSQHRSHHNSSSSSSHHHAKLSFPSGDAPDHKSGHKQQQPFSGGGSLARSRDHQTIMTSSSASAANSSRTNSASGGRSSSSLTPQANTQRQQSTQGHQLDVNYHKSRERSSISAGSVTHGVTSHTGHKLSSQKQDTTSRAISKESTSSVKMPEQAKQQGVSKMFAPPSMGVPQYGSNQSKMDPTHDVSRSMIHNQRTYGSNSNGPSGTSALGYHQSQLNRQSSGGGSNTKHDQPKPISVHMQQQQQQQHHKQSATSETPYNAGSHEQQQQQSHTHLQTPSAPHASVSYPTLRTSEVSHTTEDHSNSQLPSAHSHSSVTQSIPHTQSRTSSSMFSPPEWNEKLQPMMGGSNFSNNHLNSAPGDSFNSFKMQSSIPLSTCNKDQSPKRSDRERFSDTATKKEKGKSSHSGLDSNLMITGRSSSQQLQQLNVQQQQQQQIKSSIQKNLNPGINMTACTAIKRPNDIVTFKQEDDMLRDNKIRKIDSTSLLQTSYLDSSKLVNGIETNPDFVSSLLKEGLCPRNDLLKTEQLAVPSLQPPAELLEPTTLTTHNKSNKSGNVESLCMGIVDDQASGKTEKKKKKDKHKHKEKDKSKDREERKKHKREKERHKERDRESDNSEHVKIKISKEKLEGGSGSSESLGFKIKIPKDRITNEINSGGGSGSGIVHGNVNAAVETNSSTATPALKIKISKDKLENYSSGPHADSLNAVPLLPTTALSSAGLYSSFVPQGVVSTSVSSHSSSSSKKKDRDRDKDKKRTVHDLTKSNGSSTAGAPGAPASISGGSVPSVNMSTTSSKSQNSSKIQQLTNNLNQLFGESNDDDDEDDNDVYNNYSEYIKSTQLNKSNSTTTVASATATTSLSSSSSSSSQALRQNNSYGSRQIQSNFNQHNSQHYINQTQQQQQQR